MGIMHLPRPLAALLRYATGSAVDRHPATAAQPVFEPIGDRYKVHTSTAPVKVRPEEFEPRGPVVSRQSEWFRAPGGIWPGFPTLAGEHGPMLRDAVALVTYNLQHWQFAHIDRNVPTDDSSLRNHQIERLTREWSLPILECWTAMRRVSDTFDVTPDVWLALRGARLTPHRFLLALANGVTENEVAVWDAEGWPAETTMITMAALRGVAFFLPQAAS